MSETKSVGLTFEENAVTRDALDALLIDREAALKKETDPTTKDFLSADIEAGKSALLKLKESGF